jgi:hypothetical protein
MCPEIGSSAYSPSRCDMQHATCNMQHATCNMQQTTCYMQTRAHMRMHKLHAVYLAALCSRGKSPPPTPPPPHPPTHPGPVGSAAGVAPCGGSPPGEPPRRRHAARRRRAHRRALRRARRVRAPRGRGHCRACRGAHGAHRGSGRRAHGQRAGLRLLHALVEGLLRRLLLPPLHPMSGGPRRSHPAVHLSTSSARLARPNTQSRSRCLFDGPE